MRRLTYENGQGQTAYKTSEPQVAPNRSLQCKNIIVMMTKHMQVFLTLAFGTEAFLMSSHKKHEALDATVHGLLALTMWACTLCTLGELFAQHSMLATAGRTLSCLMQGMWLIQVTYPAPLTNPSLNIYCPKPNKDTCNGYACILKVGYMNSIPP